MNEQRKSHERPWWVRPVTGDLAIELWPGDIPHVRLVATSYPIRVSLDDMRALVEVLMAAAGDLADAMADELVLDQIAEDDWRRFVGRVVRVPGGGRGTVITRAGDWSESGNRGWFTVAVLGKGWHCYYISDLELQDES
jgi:hypothetical protein